MVLSEKPEAKQWQIPFYYHRSCGRAVWRLLSLKNTLHVWEVIYTAIPSVFGMIKAFSSISLQISSSASPGPDDEKPGKQISSGSPETLHCRTGSAILMKHDSNIFLFIIYYVIYLFIYHDWPFLDFGIIGTLMDFRAEPGDFIPFYSTSPKPLRALSAHEWWHGWHNLLSAHSSYPIEHKEIQAPFYKQEALISILLSARASGWLRWSWPPPGLPSPSLLPW